ncbi:MAG: hypothetical protein ACR2OZ_00790 [Verrucomicrobiales bacterium]
MPLHFFYEQEGKTMPAIEFVAPAVMPENERELLVHDHDMTSALEEYHQCEIGLSVIAREQSESYLMRLVVLERLRAPRIPVEFGAIGIHLEFFAGPVRRLIVAGEKPLGAVLQDEHIHYHSEPKGFFKVRADGFISTWLAESEETIIWGRCNTLMDCQGEVFADIVEILPRALAAVPGSVHRNAQGCHSRKSSVH